DPGGDTPRGSPPADPPVAPGPWADAAPMAGPAASAARRAGTRAEAWEPKAYHRRSPWATRRAPWDAPRKSAAWQWHGRLRRTRRKRMRRMFPVAVCVGLGTFDASVSSSFAGV